jgi:hypothetical protein
LIVDDGAVVDGEGAERVVGVRFDVDGYRRVRWHVALNFRHTVQVVVRDFLAHIRIREDLGVAYRIVRSRVAMLWCAVVVDVARDVRRPRVSNIWVL